MSVRAPDPPNWGPLIWLLTALTALGQLSISMYAPSLPAIAAGLGTTAGMVQLTLSMFLISFAVSQLVLGPLSDRYGRRRVLLGGLAVFVAGSLACGLASGIEALVAARAVQAFGACAGASVGRAVVRDLFERDEAARVMAVMGMAFAAAPAAGPIVGGYLQAAFGWPAVFLFLAALGGVLLMLSAWRLPETNRQRDPDAMRLARMVATYRTLARNRVFLGYSLPAMAWVGGMLAMHACMPFLLIQSLGVSPTVYGWLTLSTVVAFFMASLFASRMGPRLGLDRLIHLSLGIQAVAVVLALGSALLAPLSVVGVLGPMMLWVFAMGSAFPACMAGAMAPFPRAAGSASALMGFFQMVAGAFGSMFIARVQDGTLLPPALMLAGFAAIGILGYRHLATARHLPGAGDVRPAPRPGE